MVKIYIHDKFDPEALAMMQALYSRSTESVENHVQKVQQTGSAKFMESYYVGYGHSSIGDCGTTTLFLEGVSILAAKAIQDNPLYSGQETSTRYIDFSKQTLFDPVNTDESIEILRSWINFYIRATEKIRCYLKEKFPLQENQHEAIWEKAINARSFDILRGYIPAGATTQLSWSTNLRQAREKLSVLRFHPLKEVQDLANDTFKQLRLKYPSSFSHEKNSGEEKYYKRFSLEHNYSNYQDHIDSDDVFLYESTINNSLLEREEYEVISSRPKGVRLPRYLTRYGRYVCKFLLDYGSYRDLQRHRNGLCRIPILTADREFNSWYINQLPEVLKKEACGLIARQYGKISELKKKHKLSEIELQYYLPMGANILCELVYDLPEMVYVAELRSSITVHPTLRKIAQKMHKALVTNHPSLILYTDTSEDKFDIRRGKQDILQKQ